MNRVRARAREKKCCAPKLENRFFCEFHYLCISFFLRTGGSGQSLSDLAGSRTTAGQSGGIFHCPGHSGLVSSIAKEAAEKTAAAALAARAAKKAAKTAAEPQAAAAAPGRALSAEELALKDATLALARRGGSGRREERTPEINNHRGVELKVPARPNACAHSTIPTLMEPW